MKKKEIELYLHIPFCVRKCAYCDFLSAPGSTEQKKAYVEALKKEIIQFPCPEKYTVSTVFLGGGTPSVLPSSAVDEVLELLHGRFTFAAQPELTIECNPGTADLEKLRDYHRMGINRISFGLQSADNRELKALGRIHSWEDFLCTYEQARQAGMENINVDLMSALPLQTEASWEQTLSRVLALRPEHISAYSLIIEEGTPFYEKYEADVEARDRGDEPQFLPSEDTERRMYRMTEVMLEAYGLHRYEISNYALPGRECRHNIGYWTGTEYAGFGLGASGLLGDIRYRNTESLSDYLNGDFSGRIEEVRDRKAQMEEFMFLGLRMIKGVSEEEFRRRFGTAIDDIYGDVLRGLTGKELLRRIDGQIALSSRGIDLSNMVMAEFLL